ncbi:hypothetical protein, partial [Streptococcus sanguinis]|uniref:hypothetical protein n=1 Tax=Streptococcus sanguinis TaxID=1305 RepID=UPI001D14D536
MITQTKISFSDIKLKNLLIFNSNVEISQFATVVFARIISARDEQNQEIQNQIEKIRLECVDTKLAQILLQANQSLMQVNTFTVEIIADNKALLSQINIDSLQNQNINLANAASALKWVSKFGSGS